MRAPRESESGGATVASRRRRYFAPGRCAFQCTPRQRKGVSKGARPVVAQIEPTGARALCVGRAHVSTPPTRARGTGASGSEVGGRLRKWAVEAAWHARAVAPGLLQPARATRSPIKGALRRAHASGSLSPRVPPCHLPFSRPHRHAMWHPRLDAPASTRGSMTLATGGGMKFVVCSFIAERI